MPPVLSGLLVIVSPAARLLTGSLRQHADDERPLVMHNQKLMPQVGGARLDRADASVQRRQPQ